MNNDQSDVGYSRAEGKSTEELEAELRSVFDNYPEYSDPALGGRGFEAMVETFATDGFYKLHLVARAYRRQAAEASA